MMVAGRRGATVTRRGAIVGGHPPTVEPRHDESRVAFPGGPVKRMALGRTAGVVVDAGRLAPAPAAVARGGGPQVAGREASPLDRNAARPDDGHAIAGRRDESR